MTERKRPRMTTVKRPEDIPQFASEAEEAAFWDTHTLGDAMWARKADLDDVLPARPRAKLISVRFEADSLRRLKALARRRGMPYQTLLKQFVAERLYEEERRDGVVGGDRGPGDPVPPAAA
jgi:predicted DNA binding CopG/RHH family protein